MRLFVTGATGFIGHHFVSAALAAGHSVSAHCRPGSRSRRDAATVHNSLTWVESELDEVPSLALERIDALVHFAAHGVNPKDSDWNQCFKVNVASSLSLWVKAADSGVRRLVVSGSCFEYGQAAERYDFVPADAPLEPTGAYHSSKAAASMAAYGLAVDRKLELAILRPFHVFGEGEHPDRLWPSLKRAALAGENYPMTLGEQVRDFVPVEQVADAFVRALDLPLSSSRSPLVANIGTGRPQTLLAFAELWWAKWGATGKLLPGTIPYRENEVMRYVPSVDFWPRHGSDPTACMANTP